MRYAPLRMCRNRAGWETEPAHAVRIDLGNLEACAASAGLVPLVNAGVLAVYRWGALELSVFETGRMLFKTKDPAEALGGMKAVYAALGWAWEAPGVIA